MPSSEDREPWLETETRASGPAWQPAGPILIPGLTILYHPDPGRIGERAPLASLASGRDEPLSRRDPDFAAPGGPPGRRPLSDPHLTRTPLHLRPGPDPGSVRLVRGECSMAVAAGGEPVGAEVLFSAAEVERGVVLLLAQHVVLLLSLIDPTVPGGLPRYGLVGESPEMIRLRQEIRRIATLSVPVLLRGATGTGKELVARALHDAGPRAARPYLAVNLGAVPATLAPAELFGAVRGAYTGADRPREGWFARAQGGTLFLDEIGEAPPEVQVLLLRALETGEIQPVGGGAPRHVDVRLVAATDADLEAAVTEGRFRAPLLHRLGAYQLRLPSLCDRREDFGRLFIHFLRQERAALDEPDPLPAGAPESRPIPAALVARLAALDWPGNVRQLRNVVRRLVVAGQEGGEGALWVQAEAALRETAGPRPSDTRGTAPVPGVPVPRPAAVRRFRRAEDVTDEELIGALRINRWRIQSAAAELGISRGSLYDRIEKSAKIRKAADLSREEIEACLQRCGGDLDAMVEKLEVSKRGLQRRMTQLGLG